MSDIMTQCGQVNGPYFYFALGNRMGSHSGICRVNEEERG